MKLRFSRSGGFANISTGVELDSTKMADDNLKTLQEKLGKITPFVSPPNTPEGAADLHNYSLEVEDGEQTHKLSVNDANASEDMFDLFDFLLQQ